MDGPLLDSKGLLNFDFKPSEFIEDEVTVDRLQAMKEAINRGAIISVVNGEFRITRKGKILICRGNTNQPTKKRAFWVRDKSTVGSLGLVVQPGIVKDLINSGLPWTAKINGVLITSVPSPVLTVTLTATIVFLHATIDPMTGVITALVIEVDTGAGLPASSQTDWYLEISTLTIDGTDSNKRVTAANDGISGSQVYSICGVLPLTDGTAFVNGLM